MSDLLILRTRQTFAEIVCNCETVSAGNVVATIQCLLFNCVEVSLTPVRVWWCVIRYCFRPSIQFENMLQWSVRDERDVKWV